MELNYKEIERIINDVDMNNDEHAEISFAGCMIQWYENFLYYENQFKEELANIDISEKGERLRLFQKTDVSEEEFKKLFPTIKYQKYISPLEFNVRKITENKIAHTAFLLMDHIPLQYEQLKSLVHTVYRSYSPQCWNSELITGLISRYSRKLYFDIIFSEELKKVQSKKTA